MGRGAAGRKNYGDDEDDEEYVAEEEGSSNESGGSFEESLDGSDTNNSFSSAEEKPCVKVKKSRRGCTSGRRKSSVLGEDVWEDDAYDDDSYDDDDDFSPDDSDEDEWEENSIVLGDRGISSMRGAIKRGRTKLKKKVSRTKVKKGLRKVAPAPEKVKRRRMTTNSNDKYKFIVYGRSTTKSQRKDLKKVRKRMTKSISVEKNTLSIDAYSFDSDYLTSDDDPLLNVRVSLNSSRNKKKGDYGRRRKMSKEDSETSDSDFVVSDEESLDNDFMEVARPGYSSKHKRKNAQISKKQLLVKFKHTNSNKEISEEEVNDLEIERDFNKQKHERVPEGKKGKEKEVDDLSKQFCGICLSEELDGTIQGSLNCCSHYFCFACIMEWSKVESRCPLCKRRFVTITKTSRSNLMLQMRKHVIRVQLRDQVYQPSEEELRVLLDPYEDVVCTECHQGGDDSLMLLCDICDSSAHTYCVGLGKEVPEGNWYCDCCKLAGEGSLHSQDIRGANNSRMPHCGLEEDGSNHQSSAILQQSLSSQGQSSSWGSDFNALPPRHYMEDTVSASQALGALASTLFERRARSQHVRILFSNSRARHFYAVPNGTDIALHTEAVRHSVLEQNGEQFHSSERPSSLNEALSREQQPENSRDFPHSDSNLVQNTSHNEINFQHVNGAKKQVRSMVKRYLKKLAMEIPLDRSTLKKMARKATHTILASCGIHHSRSAVSSVVEPPKDCAHDLDGGPVNLATGCCPSCFCDYVKNVVETLTDTS